MTKAKFEDLHKTVAKNTEGGDESDHFQTPFWALPMLDRYIPTDWTIWEPACGKGNIVNYLNARMLEPGQPKGLPRCWGTDYYMGEDYNFFTFQPNRRWDMIVTNPPWSLKIEWTLRCLELGNPFALLVPITYLEMAGTRLVNDYRMEIVKPYQRIAYETPFDGWWKHYYKSIMTGEVCGYKDPYEFEVCPKCGGNEDIRKIKSSPQKQSMWITHGLTIDSPITYYDMAKDIKAYQT